MAAARLAGPSCDLGVGVITDSVPTTPSSPVTRNAPVTAVGSGPPPSEPRRGRKPPTPTAVGNARSGPPPPLPPGPASELRRGGSNPDVGSPPKFRGALAPTNDGGGTPSSSSKTPPMPPELACVQQPQYDILYFDFYFCFSSRPLHTHQTSITMHV